MSLVERKIRKDEDNCPKCGKDLKNWGTFMLCASGNGHAEGYYPCSCSFCGFVGRQWYKMKFDCMQDMQDMQEKIKDGTFEDLP